MGVARAGARSTKARNREVNGAMKRRWTAIRGRWPAVRAAAAAALLSIVSCSPVSNPYGEAISAGRVLIDSLMAARNVPGLSIAVSVDGEVVWSEGFGFADLEQESPVLPTTKFRIGSISKSLTAAAVGQLYEQGRLDLDAPVQRYVPSFPKKRKGVITTRLLAGHLAGVRHYLDDDSDFHDTKRYNTVLDGLGMFADDTLLHAPGSKYSYSSYGWNLISAVVESASGEHFLSYMRENVFGPLGMEHTGADHTDSVIPGRTGFYVRGADSTVVNAPYVDNSYKWAGGGFLSTPEDLLRFAHAHYALGFLEAETLELLFTSQRDASGDEIGYGVGWRVGEWKGRRRIWHGGGSVGGNCRLVFFPDERVALAVTANMSDVGYGDVPERIAELFVK